MYWFLDFYDWLRGSQHVRRSCFRKLVRDGDPLEWPARLHVSGCLECRERWRQAEERYGGPNQRGPHLAH